MRFDSSGALSRPVVSSVNKVIVSFMAWIVSTARASGPTLVVAAYQAARIWWTANGNSTRGKTMTVDVSVAVI